MTLGFDVRQVHVLRGRTEVVRGVSWNILPGRLSAILGPNGAGKSTLLRVMAGVLPLSAGDVVLDGKSQVAWDRRQWARKVAWLSQTSERAPDFSVLDYALLGRAPHLGVWSLPSSRDVARARQILDALELGALASRRLSQLSGGERRMVAIARALVQDAAVVLLDEPTAYLDLKHQVEVLTHLRTTVAQGAAVVVVLHDVNLAAAFADDVLLLKAGQVVAQGSASQVLSSETLERVFDVRLKEATADGHRMFGLERRQD